jgi:hypothetical protein
LHHTVNFCCINSVQFSAGDDGDGYSEVQGDCADTDATIYPSAFEICGDGIDQDCDGGADPLCPEDIDNDGDGYTENQGDCNDANSSINPNAEDVCGDGIDQDCNGTDLSCNTGGSIVGTWCATRIDGAIDPDGYPLVVTCDVSTFTFHSNGTYSWFLHALPYYYWDDSGTYSYENQIITFSGDASQLPADGYIEFTEGSNSFTFLDEDGDRWIYERSECSQAYAIFTSPACQNEALAAFEAQDICIGQCGMVQACLDGCENTLWNSMTSCHEGWPQLFDQGGDDDEGICGQCYLDCDDAFDACLDVNNVATCLDNLTTCAAECP